MNRNKLEIKKYSKYGLQRSIRTLINLALLSGFISLTGCAGIHLYNPDNDTTASLVKKTSDEINFQAVIEKERKNQAKLLNRELEVIAQAALASRNTMLRALLEDRIIPSTSGVESLSKKQERMLNARLFELIGRNNANPFDYIDKWNDSLENLNTTIRLFEKTLPTSAPACKIGVDADFSIDEKKINEYTAVAELIKSDVNVQHLLENFKEHCETHQKAWKGLANSGGIFSAIAKEETEANDNLVNQKEAKKAAEKEYNEALEEYEEALKQAETDASDVAKKKITEKAKQLKQRLNDLSQTGILGKQSAAKLQIDKIDLVLDVLAKGKLDEEKLKCSDIKEEDVEAKKKCLDTKQALTMVAQLPGFAGRFATIEALTELPPINALLFEKERLMALKEDADKQIGRTQSKIALLQLKRNAAFDEIESLMRSKQHVGWARLANKNREIKLSDLYQSSINESARRHMIIAMTTYLNTYVGPKRLMNEIKYYSLDIEHMQALDATETALRLWEVAIKQPINVLAAYHSSGVKKEELIKLSIEALKAAGLFTIAGGVIN